MKSDMNFFRFLTLALVFGMVLSVSVSCGGGDEDSSDAGPAATQPPQASSSKATPKPETKKVEKPKATQKSMGDLRVAITALSHESNFHWVGTFDSLIGARPAAEYLLDVDPLKGVEVPMLATSWKMSADAKTWTFNIREDVPFHFGYGNVTSKDVELALELVRGEDAIQSNTSYWRNIIDSVHLPDDHTIELNLTNGDPDLYWAIAANGEIMIPSTKQWDGGAGRDAFDEKPAYTGPYQYVDRVLGNWIQFEKVPYDHWRVDTDFDGLKMHLVPEDFTRLAMILAGEVDISSVSRALHPEVREAGMVIIPGNFPSISANAMFGGQYYLTPETLDESIPWANLKTGKLVREAMNRAINREEIIDVLFSGVGEPMPVVAHHQTKPGFDDRWLEKQPSGKTLYDERYGYDPEKARELLAQAGYPDGFEMTFHTFPQSGFPETRDLADSFQLYFEDIGIKVNLVENPSLAGVREHYKGRTSDFMWIFRGGSRLPANDVRIFYAKEGIVHVYESDEIEKNYAAFKQSVDPEERDRLMTAVGEEIFEEYARIPIAWFFFDVAVDPKRVAAYDFPGTITGIITHLDSVKAAR